jgi:radical SAM superfamily enzyme YgiQ (UPF0313 family)
MKKVLLIFPNTANRPFITAAIPILAGIAKEKCWECSYFDTSNYQKESDSIEDKEKFGFFMNHSIDFRTGFKSFSDITKDLQSLIDNFKPNLIAITAMTCDYEFLMTWWREIDTKGAISTIGGFHATVAHTEIEKEKLFDIICIGQGESVFCDILDNIDSGTECFSNIDGVSVYNKKDKIYSVGKKKKLLSPELLWKIKTDYSLFDQSYFRFPFDGKTMNLFQIDAGRGCPYSCSYCGNNSLRQHYKGLGKYVCTRPMESTFSVMRQMLVDRQVDIFSFTDECFLARSSSWIRVFFEKYKNEICKPFIMQTRAETITNETLDILSSVGVIFFQIGLGVESGSVRILEKICNRMIKPDEIIRAYDLMHTYPNIRTNAYFMLGFPTETREEIWMTINLCKRIKSKVNSASIYQPFPGQTLREKCIELGYIKGNERMESFTGKSVLKQPHITSEEISGLWRTFILYAKLPESFYPDIEKCEKTYNKEMFDKLIALRWNIEKTGS